MEGDLVKHMAKVKDCPQSPPFSPVLRGEGTGVRGENSRKAHPLTPTPLPRIQGRGAYVPPFSRLYSGERDFSDRL